MSLTRYVRAIKATEQTNIPWVGHWGGLDSNILMYIAQIWDWRGLQYQIELNPYL